MLRRLPVTLFLIFVLSLQLAPSYFSHAQLSSITTSPTPFSNSINPNNQNIVYGTGFNCRPEDSVILEDCSYLDVFDFSDKAHPVLLYATTTNAATSIVVAHGDYAYTAQYSGKLTTYDMSVPSAPVITDAQQMPESIQIGSKLRIIDGYLVAPFAQNGFSAPGGILFFDLSDPAAPTIAKRIDFSQNESGGGDVVKSGNYLYSSDYFGYTLRVYDITDILNPILVQTISNVTDSADYKVINGTGLFEPWGVTAKDNALYLFDDNIIRIYDISSSTNMVYSKTVVAQKDVEGFAIRDSILYYSASFDDKLSYYDVSDALNPTLISAPSTSSVNNNYWISIDDNGYYYVSSTENNIISVYEPLKIVKSTFVVDVVQDSQKTYSLRLATAPSSDVLITLATSTSESEPCITVSPSSMTFTPSNWNSQQTITVRSVSGGAGCPLNSEIAISTTASSSDSYYNNALVSNVKATVVAGFTSVLSGFWDSASTWGLISTGLGVGIDYPGSSSSVTIIHTVALATSSAANLLSIKSGGELNFLSGTLGVTLSFINSGTVNSVSNPAIFTGKRSYNEGVVNGSISGNLITFTDEAYNANGGTVNGNVIFKDAGYNLGTVNGNSTFIGNVTDATGVTNGNVIRLYTSDTTTTRNFTTDNGRNDWIIIADGAIVDITGSTYATSTDVFKAINGGSFIYGGNAEGKVVPNVIITTPVASSTSVKWLPVINWDDSSSCAYSYDNFVTTLNSTCSNNGSDIAKPSTQGTTTLYVRGTNVHGSLTEKRVTFYYDNTSAIPTACGSDLLDEPSRAFYYLEGNVTANCIVTTDTELRGASSSNAVGFTLTGNVIATSTLDGHNVTLKNITITGNINSSGENGGNFGSSGGTITIATSTTGAVISNGGNGNTTGGNGGIISITNSTGVASSTTITANGGNSTVCGHGGDGGSVTLLNSSYASVTTNAGNDQTLIGVGLCAAPPSGHPGGTGRVVNNGTYTPPSNTGPSNPAAAVGANVGGDDSTGVTSPSNSAGTHSNPLVTVGSTSTTIVRASTTVPAESKANNGFLNSIGLSKETINNVIKNTDTVTNTPITKVVQTAGFIAALVSTANTVFATPLLASELLLIPVRLWGLVMMGLGLRRKIVPWGTVYDSVTKRPIDPAYVTVANEDGKIVAEAITDVDGRYGFLLPDGKYRLSAQKTNYEFPSKKLNNQAADEVYEQLYHGEYIVIHSGEVIGKNIPLDPIGFDWNEYAKNENNATLFHKKHEKRWSIIGSILFKAGMVLTIVSSIVHPSSYNIIILIVYLLISVFPLLGIKGRQFGFIVNKLTGRPLAYAIFRVLSLDHQTVFRSGVCDEKGRYYCIVPKGQYYLDIEKKNADGTYTKVYESGIVSGEKGIINTNFSV